MKTGNTRQLTPVVLHRREASMEPGHEDREYRRGTRSRHGEAAASMEPGHEDREYPHRRGVESETSQGASMEPGHEDREYFASTWGRPSPPSCLNGARS